jgi:hypothetical protein
MIKSLLLTAFLAAAIVQHATAQRQAMHLRNNGGDRSLYGPVLPVAPKRRNLQASNRGYLDLLVPYFYH